MWTWEKPEGGVPKLEATFRLETNLSQPERTRTVSSLICHWHHWRFQVASIMINFHCTPEAPVLTLRLWTRLHFQVHSGYGNILSNPYNCHQNKKYTYLLPRKVKENWRNPQKLINYHYQLTIHCCSSEWSWSWVLFLQRDNKELSDRQRLKPWHHGDHQMKWLTHDDNGMPATTRKVWHMVERAKDGPWHGRTNLWTKSLVSRHSKSPISCISPCKNLIVCKKQNGNCSHTSCRLHKNASVYGHILAALTLSCCDRVAVPARNFVDNLASKWSNQDLHTLVFLEVFDTELAILVTPECDEATAFCEIDLRMRIQHQSYTF